MSIFSDWLRFLALAIGLSAFLGSAIDARARCNEEPGRDCRDMNAGTSKTGSATKKMSIKFAPETTRQKAGGAPKGSIKR